MTSSYTSNTGIEKPATGDQSGTWGDTVNVNMDIIDRVLNGVGAISLSGTTHTITTSDGSLSDGMYRVLVLGGSPSGTNTITVSPNDQDKVFFVKNGTGQSVVFTQGSGANVTIASGDTKIIYCDGAGAGAAVVDFTNDLSMSSVSITGGTVTGITINSSAIGGSTPAAGAFTTLDATGDVTGANFQPDGDTAASDSAAIGYTAVEGLILTGQGSTNDVTIKNDADADVLEIPTGTTNVTVVGNVTAGGNLISTGTVEPAGDTTAGDLAAFGYTSVLGAIITGQGSTNDVTLVNDADATVLSIPTGTTKVVVAGTLTANTDTDTSNTGSVTLDFSVNQNFVLTLTGNVTLANPSTEQVGQAGVFVFIQDGTGSRTLSLGTDYESPAGAGIVLSTAAAAVDVVPYFVKASGSIQLGAPQLAFA